MTSRSDLDLIQTGYPSVRNVTNVPLDNGAVFYGYPDDVTIFGALNYTLYTDQDTSVDFLWGPDGSYNDITESWNALANVPYFRNQNVKGRYFRLRLTNNSGLAQTFLRSTLVYRSFASDSISVSGDVTINPLNYSTDSVTARLQSGTGTAIGATGDSLNVHMDSAVEVDLSANNDSVQAWLHSAGGTALTATGSALDVQVAGTVPVTLDDALVRIADSSGNSLTSIDGRLNINYLPLEYETDSITPYAYDGANFQPIACTTAGHQTVNVDNCGALCIGLDGANRVPIGVTESGYVLTQSQDQIDAAGQGFIDASSIVFSTTPLDLFTIHCTNFSDGSAVYFKLYDFSVDVDPQVDAALVVIPVLPMDKVVIPYPAPISFTVGLTLRATLGSLDDNTDPPPEDTAHIAIYYNE